MPPHPPAPVVHEGGFAFDANGRILCVDAGSIVPPLSRMNGLTFDSSGAVVTVTDLTAPDSFNNGWPFAAGGALEVVINNGALGSAIRRAGVTYADSASADVLVTNSGAIASWCNGKPFAATGALCVSGI